MIFTKEHLELVREIRQGMAELEMISHAPTVNFHPQIGRDVKEHPGGKRPQGDNRERPVGEMERLDALDAYEVKTVDYYRRWLRGLHAKADQHDLDWLIGKLTELRDDIRDTLERWRRPPLKQDQPPTMADPGFKRFVMTCGWDLKRLVDHYGCSRQYLKRILASDWSARDESEDEQRKREKAEWQRRRAA